MNIELDPFEEIQELTQRLNYYRDAYYNQNTSLISDEEYDDLFDRLIELEAETGDMDEDLGEVFESVYDPNEDTLDAGNLFDLDDDF